MDDPCTEVTNIQNCFVELYISNDFESLNFIVTPPPPPPLFEALDIYGKTYVTFRDVYCDCVSREALFISNQDQKLHIFCDPTRIFIYVINI